MYRNKVGKSKAHHHMGALGGRPCGRRVGAAGALWLAGKVRSGVAPKTARRRGVKSKSRDQKPTCWHKAGAAGGGPGLHPGFPLIFLSSTGTSFHSSQVGLVTPHPIQAQLLSTVAYRHPSLGALFLPPSLSPCFLSAWPLTTCS